MNNHIVIAGITNSIDFPTTYLSNDSTSNGLADAFITKLQINEVYATSASYEPPFRFALSQNYPNPFNSSTTISYSIPSASVVSLKLYDLNGREISTLVEQRQQAGSYRVQFDGKGFASGTYFVRLHAGERFSKVQKVVLLK